MVQIGETKSVVDCKVSPVALEGQDRIRFPPEETNETCGGPDNEMLKMVPLPEVPPYPVMP